MKAIAPVEEPGGVELSDAAVHLLRTAMKTNLALSQMADQKASILMGASFVVFTITTGQAARGNVPPSLMCLALFAFMAAVLAAIAIMPTTSGDVGPEEQRNMLFFGNFGHLSEQEFFQHLFATMATDEGILRAMLRDLHQNGAVLKRKKYKYLTRAYICLVLGLL